MARVLTAARHAVLPKEGTVEGGVGGRPMHDWGMTLRTTLDLDEPTWGDLLAFTDIGRASGLEADEKVELVRNQNGDLDGLVVVLKGSGVPKRPSLSAEEAAEYAAVIDDALIDGDARMYGSKLRELRDRLLAAG